MPTATGIANIGQGGVIGFTTTRFTEPPIVVCSIVRSWHNAYNSRPVNFSVTYINNASFSYVAKDNKPGDQVSWIAIGN